MNTDPRHCFQVKRYHTWPTLQQQTVGEHTCQILRIYTEMFGPPPADVVQGILWHDAGELWTGDVPFDAKMNYPDLRVAVSSVDEQATNELSRGRFPTELPQELRNRIKLCDLMEMAEFGREEMRLGNRHYGEQIFEKVKAAAFTLSRRCSTDTADMFHVWCRSKEI